MTPMIFAKKTVLREAYLDKIYGPKLTEAKTMKEIAEILARFCKERGFRMVRMKLDR